MLSIEVFLSTLSLRRATDFKRLGLLGWLNFYPRSPCGERPASDITCAFGKDFYPRSPCGERRIITETTKELLEISIHALLAESDRLCPVVYHTVAQFLSTLSLRRATAKVHKTVGHFCAYGTNFMGIASSC